MLLSVIIVSYNTSELTQQALQSVIDSVKNSSSLKDQTEIIIVDNRSTDGSVEVFRQLKKTASTKIILIENDHNLGFSSANNQGIEQAQGAYILLLNSDTIVQPRALEELVDTFGKLPVQGSTAELATHQGEIDRLGILAATLLNPDETLQPQGGAFPTLISLASQMLMLDDLPVVGKWLPTTQYTGRAIRQHQGQTKLVQQDWVGGTAMMIRREVIDEIGMLDKSIFMYGEDVEFCLRARQHHWDIAIDPKSKIIHFGSASSTSANAVQGELKGYLYIWSKHKSLWQLPIVRALIRLGCLCRWVVFGTIKRDQVRASVYKRLLFDRWA